MSETSVVEAVVKRDRWIVILGLVVVIALAWWYLLQGAGTCMTALSMSSASLPWQAPSAVSMPSHQREPEAPPEQEVVAMMRQAQSAMLQPAVWTPGYALVMLVMWWVMMIAMMLPSASPMLLIVARVNRTHHTQGGPLVPTSLFAVGYLITWGGFSLLAVGAQWGLERTGLVSAMVGSTSAIFGGLVLIVAGFYQCTPLKQACLRHCRTPFQFVTHHWRTGRLGALRMGLDHGAFCVACCWFLMALLFVGGVMNLYWIIGLALLVLLEKTLPGGQRLSTAIGVGLILWGGWILVEAQSLS
jgi:predicted metal-binding membrane protein